MRTPQGVRLHADDGQLAEQPDDDVMPAPVARANGDEIGMTTTLAALKSVARQYDACKAAATS